MARRTLALVDGPSNPVAERIAVALAKVGLALKHQSWQVAGELGTTPTQAQILAMLSTQRGMRPSEIAEKLAVSFATASVAVRTLAERGLVAKEADPTDARSTRVKLTAAGARQARRVADGPDFLASAVDVMDPREQGAFLTALVKVIHTLQERGQIPLSKMCVSCAHFRANAHPASQRPHHCMFVDTPMAAENLRIDCTEHQQADPGARAATWAQFAEFS